MPCQASALALHLPHLPTAHPPPTLAHPYPPPPPLPLPPIQHFFERDCGSVAGLLQPPGEAEGRVGGKAQWKAVDPGGGGGVCVCGGGACTVGWTFPPLPPHCNTLLGWVQECSIRGWGQN
jgi:hypothetical protein